MPADAGKVTNRSATINAKCFINLRKRPQNAEIPCAMIRAASGGRNAVMIEEVTLRFMSRILLLMLVVVCASTSVFASGFLIPEQGAKASAMAGAFTATADDPSAIFFNVAGIAQQRETALYGGANAIDFNNQLRGDPNDEFRSGADGKYRRHTFAPAT